MKMKTTLIFAFALLVIVIACNKRDITKRVDQKYSVSTVKEWYYGTFKKSAEWARYNSAILGKKLPDWKHGSYLKLGGYEIVEFPLVKEKSTFFIFEKDLNESEQVSAGSVSRIAFIKTNSGEIIVREINFIPTLQYLKSQNYDISRNSIGRVSKDFSGIIISKNWKGSILSASSLKDGSIVNRLKRTFVQTKGNRTESICPVGSTEVTEWERECEWEPIGDDVYVKVCGDWYPTGNVWCFQDPEEELPSECQDPGSEECFCQLIGGCGGGGGDLPEDCTQESLDDQIDGIVSQHGQKSNKISVDTESSTALERTKKYSWLFYGKQAGFPGQGIDYSSQERGVQQIGTDGLWRWTSFQHIGETPSGGSIIFDLTVNNLTATPSITNIPLGMPPVTVNHSIASMNLAGAMKFTLNCAGATIVTRYPNFNVTNSWSTYD